jgi:hypothetical protein
MKGRRNKGENQLQQGVVFFFVFCIFFFLRRYQLMNGDKKIRPLCTDRTVVIPFNNIAT